MTGTKVLFLVIPHAYKLAEINQDNVKSSFVKRKPRSTIRFLFEYYSTAVILKCYRIA